MTKIPASAPAALDASGMPSVSSSMRPGEPVAVAATTALSAALIASRRSLRLACLTLLKIRAVARLTADVVGVFRRQRLGGGDHPQADLELVRVDALLLGLLAHRLRHGSTISASRRPVARSQRSRAWPVINFAGR